MVLQVGSLPNKAVLVNKKIGNIDFNKVDIEIEELKKKLMAAKDDGNTNEVARLMEKIQELAKQVTTNVGSVNILRSTGRQIMSELQKKSKEINDYNNDISLQKSKNEEISKMSANEKKALLLSEFLKKDIPDFKLLKISNIKLSILEKTSLYESLGQSVAMYLSIQGIKAKTITPKDIHFSNAGNPHYQGWPVPDKNVLTNDQQLNIITKFLGKGQHIKDLADPIASYSAMNASVKNQFFTIVQLIKDKLNKGEKLDKFLITIKNGFNITKNTQVHSLNRIFTHMGMCNLNIDKTLYEKSQQSTKQLSIFYKMIIVSKLTKDLGRDKLQQIMATSDSDEIAKIIGKKSAAVMLDDAGIANVKLDQNHILPPDILIPSYFEDLEVGKYHSMSEYNSRKSVSTHGGHSFTPSDEIFARRQTYIDESNAGDIAKQSMLFLKVGRNDEQKKQAEICRFLIVKAGFGKFDDDRLGSMHWFLRGVNNVPIEKVPYAKMGSSNTYAEEDHNLYTAYDRADGQSRAVTFVRKLKNLDVDTRKYWGYLTEKASGEYDYTSDQIKGLFDGLAKQSPGKKISEGDLEKLNRAGDDIKVMLDILKSINKEYEKQFSSIARGIA